MINCPSSAAGLACRSIRQIVATLILVLAMMPVAAAIQSSAVIIMYHRFGESRYPTTNTTLEQLNAQIAELKSGAYTVLPVAEIIDRLKAGKSLPDRAVGITIDDAYQSIYRIAWPRFREAGLPFTVFVSTGSVDQGLLSHLSWAQIREMQASGRVDIGQHTVSHLHMPSADDPRIASELQAASDTFDRQLGQVPQLFAYPYGESSQRISAAVRKAGFTAAFGQQSGVIGSIGDFYDLPRFAMNEKYGDMARFRMALNALPLPVRDITPTDSLLADVNPPAIGFTLQLIQPDDGALACFTSHEGHADVERLGPSRVEVRVRQPFPTGRTRLNCTLPGPDGRWRWMGRQFLNLPDAIR